MLRPLLLPSALLAASLSGVLLAPSASAATLVSVDDVVQELSDDRVYVDPGFRVDDLQEGDLRDALSGSDVDLYVAAVPEQLADSAGGIERLVQTIGDDIGDSNAAVLVISDAPDVYAANGDALGSRGVNAGDAAEQNNTERDFDAAGITAFVAGVSDTLDQQLAGGGAPDGGGSTGGGSGGAPAGLLPLLLVGGLGFGAYALTRSRKRAKAGRQELEDLRADVESLYGRLGSDVGTLAPGDDAIARQALADAAERYNATGALMAKADTPGEFAAARRTAAEGLVAARVVRSRLGLDPGPEVPLPPSEGPQLEVHSRVQVGDEEYEGSPQYEPGRPHYYEGGYYGDQRVPGGWYATPFWQTLLLTSALNSGRGGFGGGYGGSYGGGYGGGGYGGGGYGGGGFGGGGVSGGFGGGVFGGRARRSGRGGGSIGFGGGSGGGGAWGSGGRRSGGGAGWGRGGGRRKGGGW